MLPASSRRGGSNLNSDGSELRALQHALEQAETLTEQLTRRAQSAEGEHAATVTSLKAYEASIRHYQSVFDATLSSYKEQRAWRLMLFVRKLYDLWMRHGLRGKLSALKLLLWAPFTSSTQYADQELRFPSINQFLPATLTSGIPESPEEEVPRRSLLRHSSLQRKYDVVILAIIDFDFRFQRPQQLAVQFARQGHRVFWISPSRLVAPHEPDPYFIRELGANLWEVHLQGTHNDVYLGSLETSALQSFEESLNALYKDYAIAENVVFIQLPFWRKLALELRARHNAILAYDCMDEWDAFENIGEFNRQEEVFLAKQSDVLIVTARRLAEKFANCGLDPLLVRNGVDYEFFNAKRSNTLALNLPKPIVGYFGAIADWIDLDLIRRVAIMRPQYSFVLIGQTFERDTESLASLSNVHFLGHQPYERIPAFLEQFDVCQIPFLINDVTAATDPVKLYEYLSHGKPVVATAMSELQAFRDVVYLADNASDFAAKLDQALSEDDSVRQQHRKEFARRNTWQIRFQAIDAALSEKFPRVSILIVTYNSERFIGPCLESIWRNSSHPNIEVIVVDNASTDATRSIIEEHRSSRCELQCVYQQINAGFAAANNIAARQATGEYLIFLNADVIVTPGWIGRLVNHLRCEPAAGLICPVTNFAGNEAKISTSYSCVDSMEHFANDLAYRERGRLMELPMVPLFCAIMRRDLFFEIGGLDERYETGMFEDDDLSAAVRTKGCKLFVAEDCFIHHFGQGSFSKLPGEEYNRLFNSNRERFEKKWKTVWKTHSVRAGVRPAHQDTRMEPELFCVGKIASYPPVATRPPYASTTSRILPSITSSP